MSRSPQRESSKIDSVSTRIYATAYRSITVPCETALCWDSIAPPCSIASWGCSIVDRCDIDDADPRIRTISLRPTDPGVDVFIRERLIKAERTPAGEKASVCYENIDTGSASPFPVQQLVEMQTTLSISKVTTLTSPLGRSFIEMRSTFVVCDNEDAKQMRDFLEQSYFDPLLMCLCEMLVPSSPFRDSMFAAVMSHFERTIQDMAAAAARLSVEQARDLPSNALGKNKLASSPSSPSCSSSPPQQQQKQEFKHEVEDPINVPNFAAVSVSSCQELFSAWLETARELRRLEKKIEVDEHERDRLRYGGGANSEQPGDAAERKKRFNYEAAAAARRPQMQEQVGLNVNGMFNKNFELSTPGTYIISAPVAARVQETVDYAKPEPQLSPSGLSPAQELQQRRRQPNHPPPPPPRGWQQEQFDDAADEIVAEDGGNVFGGKGELMQNAPPPPPRRVLGGR